MPIWVWKYGAIAIAFVALGGYAGWQHIKVLELEKAAIDDKLTAQIAVNMFVARDNELTAKLTVAQAAEAQAIREKASAQQLRIAGVATSDVCINSPAGRAFLTNGVRASDKAGDRDAKPAARPGGPVPLGTGAR